MENKEPILVVKDLKQHFKINRNFTVKAVDGISFDIMPGETYGLVGESGSGKSTLCSILNKYITDYTGDILFGTMNYKDLSIKTIRDNIVYVGQNENIFTGSIKENITFGNKVSDLNFDKICKICKVDDVANKKTFS